MDLTAFRKYDIRGIVGQNITKELIAKIAYGLVKMLKEENYSSKTQLSPETPNKSEQRLKIAIGYDMRESSLEYSQILASSLQKQGVDVINIGMCTTPMLNFVIINLGLDAGAMITASHSPQKYNGIKLIKKKGLQLYMGGGLEKIKEHIEQSLHQTESSKLTNTAATSKNIQNSTKPGGISTLDSLYAYLQKLQDLALNYVGMKIVCDYGNGVGAISAKPFFNLKKCDVIHMYDTPNGSFPNHPANPHDLENIKDLQEKVLLEKADIGVFFDGDADRAYFVDEQGKIIMADLLLALLSEYEIQENQDEDEKVYFDLRMSKILPEVIQNAGATPIMMKVGNPFYKEKIIQEGGLLAGELSGHIMFADHNAIDDGLYCTIKILNILTKSGKTLSQLISPYQKYFASEEMNFKVTNANDAIQTIKETFQDTKGVEVLEIDGITIKEDSWWTNIRKSNTEPLIRVRIEADSKEILSAKTSQILNMIEPFVNNKAQIRKYTLEQNQ